MSRLLVAFLYILYYVVCKDAALLSDNGDNIQFELHFVETESNDYSINVKLLIKECVINQDHV